MAFSCTAEAQHENREPEGFLPFYLKDASDLLKCRDRGLEVEKMDKATTQALPYSQGIHYLHVLTFLPHIFIP